MTTSGQLHLGRGRRKDLVLITGAHGFLGQHVVRLFLDESNANLVLTAREEKTLFADIAEEPRVQSYHSMDVTLRSRVREVIASVKPDVIVNCAAFVKVDECEVQRERAWKTNVNAVEHLAEAARKVDARMIHVSTDFIFDGTKPPYTESDAPHPLNYYGRTKLASENVLRTAGIEHTIIRPALLYGAAERANTNYALTVISSLEKGEKILAGTDLYSSPTLIDDVALGIVRAVEKNRTGIYHIAGSEMISRFDFATRIAKMLNLDTSLIEPVTYTELQSRANLRADRPLKSALVSLKAQTDLGLRISNVEEGLQVMMRGLQELQGPTEQFLYE